MNKDCVYENDKKIEHKVTKKFECRKCKKQYCKFILILLNKFLNDYIVINHIIGDINSIRLEVADLIFGWDTDFLHLKHIQTLISH